MKDFLERDDSAINEPGEKVPLLREEETAPDCEEGTARTQTDHRLQSPQDQQPKPNHPARPWWRAYPLFSIALFITLTLVGLYIYSSPRQFYPPYTDIESARHSRESGDREFRLRLRLAFAQFMHNGTLIRQTLHHLAQFAYLRGDTSGAIKLLEESQAPGTDLETIPGPNDWAMQALCDLYLRAGRKDEALALLERWRGSVIKNGNQVSGSLVNFHDYAEGVYHHIGEFESARREERYANQSRMVPNSVYVNPDREPTDDRSDVSRLRKGCWLYTRQRYQDALALFKNINMAHLNQEQQHDLKVIGALTEYRLFQSENHYPRSTPVTGTTFFETEYMRRRSIADDAEAPQIIEATESEISLCDLCSAEATARGDAGGEPHFRHLAVDARARLNSIRDRQRPAID
ncbi:MAG: tetratricopeptide repeat protein [Candidatus Obscuribacterales bacterium]